MANTTPDTGNNEPEYFEKTRMSFGDHLLELRSCLIKSLLGVMVAFAFTIFFSKHILVFMISPIAAALEINGYPPEISTLSPPEAFITYIKVALFAGLILASPWVFYHMWHFIAVGLHPHEKRYVNTFVPFSAGLFVLGGLFFIIVVAPISFNYFISFTSSWQAPQDGSMKSFYKFLLRGQVATAPENPSDSPPPALPGPETVPATQPDQPRLTTLSFAVQKVYPFVVNITINPPASPTSLTQSPPTVPTGMAKPPVDAKTTPKSLPLIRSNFTLEKYVTLVLLLSLAFGLSFQVPLVVFLLGRLNLVNLATLRKIRKYVLFGIVIFAAVITPPDVLSQILMAIPMYLLYELGIIMLALWPNEKPQSKHI